MAVMEPRANIVLATRKLVETGLFDIEQRLVRFSNGEKRWLERLTSIRTPTVLIVPLIETDTVLLIREYCAGSNMYELVFPTGTVGPHESIYNAANRELKEEVGLGANRVSNVTVLKVAPGHSDQVTHVVLAEDLFEEKLPADEPEPLEQVKWRLSDMRSLLQLSDFAEARSIAALLLVDRLLKDRKGSATA